MSNIETKVPEVVSYYDHQEQLAREERHTNRWRIFAWVLFAALVITNLGWVIYESTYQDVVVTENAQDGEGINIIGAGDVSYGAADKDD
jgi:hypothetical protein